MSYICVNAQDKWFMEQKKIETNNLLKKIKYFLRTRIIFLRCKYNSLPVIDFKNIPIIINNFNRLTTLKRLISFLEDRGYRNIYVIDNASTYEPLLEYYNMCSVKVFRLKKNVGHKALWDTNLYKKFITGYYVYTDSDVVPCETCPDDFLEYFWKIMQKYKYATKAGFGLKIDDLPDFFEGKSKVVEWESRYWQKEVEKEIFRAPIDTTFALYRPFSKANANWYVEHYRTGGRYIALHLPWYNDTKNLPQEESFYINSCIKPTHWSKPSARRLSTSIPKSQS